MRFDIEREIRRRHRRCVKWWRLSAGVLALNRRSFASELACVYSRARPLKFTLIPAPSAGYDATTSSPDCFIGSVHQKSHFLVKDQITRFHDLGIEVPRPETSIPKVEKATHTTLLLGQPDYVK
jgi:hypothetical protein